MPEGEVIRISGMEIPLVPRPFCDFCSTPLHEEYGRWGRCWRCYQRLVALNASGGVLVTRPYAFSRAAAVGLYISDRETKGELGAEILRSKGDLAIAPIHAEAIDTVLRKRYPSVSFDLIVPIPRSHARRVQSTVALAGFLAERRKLLAREHIQLDPSYESKKDAGYEEKFSAARGKVSVPAPDAVVGRRILLVDDVLTTGGMAHWCAEALLAAGALDVNIAVVGRDVDERALTFIGYTGRA